MDTAETEPRDPEYEVRVALERAEAEANPPENVLSKRSKTSALLKQAGVDLAVCRFDAERAGIADRSHCVHATQPVHLKAVKSGGYKSYEAKRVIERAEAEEAVRLRPVTVVNLDD